MIVWVQDTATNNLVTFYRSLVWVHTYMCVHCISFMRLWTYTHVRIPSECSYPRKLPHKSLLPRMRQLPVYKHPRSLSNPHSITPTRTWASRRKTSSTGEPRGLPTSATTLLLHVCDRTIFRLVLFFLHLSISCTLASTPGQIAFRDH